MQDHFPVLAVPCNVLQLHLQEVVLLQQMVLGPVVVGDRPDGDRVRKYLLIALPQLN